MVKIENNLHTSPTTYWYKVPIRSFFLDYKDELYIKLSEDECLNLNTDTIRKVDCPRWHCHVVNVTIQTTEFIEIEKGTLSPPEEKMMEWPEIFT